MSLNWDVRNVKEEVVWNEHGKMNPRPYVLIWSTLVIQLSSITEKNVDEFYRRLNLWQYNVAHLLVDDEGKPDYLTIQDVRDMIGLKVNVIGITRLAWDRYFKDVLFREAEATVYNKTKKTQEVTF